MNTNNGHARKLVIVTGVVQGVGFRPFVYRLAGQHNLAGVVRNTAGSVEIDVEGSPEAIEGFLSALRTQAPELARVDSVAMVSADPLGRTGFAIVSSESSAAVSACIPADTATCEDCSHEILTPKDPRWHYPFTNCTNCGPRFTIIQRVPYDRPNTTMSAFGMCERCAAEYSDPDNRRYHAEPTACPACGPRVWLVEGGEHYAGDSIRRVGKLLWDGKIVAIKGLGGFHLACDARNDTALITLRRRKGRAAKPFAVMARDVSEAEKLCDLSDACRQALLSRQRPIVLAERADNSGISPMVAPGNRMLGVMLPYTPLHSLIFEYAPSALVMTSGNLSEEPLAFTNRAAEDKLAGLADAFLLHNRDIHAPCDDSVVRPVEAGLTVMVRRARGFVPDVIPMPSECDCILGTGGEQKNTFCLAWGQSAVCSQHIGDLDSVETLDYYEYAIEHFLRLLQKDPDVVVHDMHPGYMSTQYAHSRVGAELVAVQHHHAHIAACMAENGRTDRCIGLALDGTGYGTDGTIWGGEIMAADLSGFERVGHLSRIRMPGGEAAVRDPRRMAASYLHSAYGSELQEYLDRLGIKLDSLHVAAIQRQLETGLNSPITTSAGRLFDAMAAAIGICSERTYEGQPAVELEMRADRTEPGHYEAGVHLHDGRIVLDTIAVFRSAVEDRLAGTDKALVAARFHNSLVELLNTGCARAREITGLNCVALSGGVFQNGLILTRLLARLRDCGFEVLIHRLLPPNDACISYGQVVVAAGSRNLRLNGKEGEYVSCGSYETH